MTGTAIHQPKPANSRIIVFTKYPVPGKTKTRLIHLLGPAGAADLQKRLVEKTYQTAKRFTRPRGMDIEICFENGSEKKMKIWLGPDIICSRQIDGDIGSRMHRAIVPDSFQSYRYIQVFRLPDRSSPLPRRHLPK